jgi:hypothetical protein
MGKDVVVGMKQEARCRGSGCAGDDVPDAFNVAADSK